ncbi:MAG: magnesium chelatase subunit H [Rhodobacteraceae bacterium]|nr:magnesium chelatase subunit H [Paracoccaceae bacterium]
MPGSDGAYHVVIVTLDAHAASATAQVEQALQSVVPGLAVHVHAAAEWAETPEALTRAQADVARGDIILVNLLFLEEHVKAILPALQARRDHCDAMVCTIAASEIVKLTKMGALDMAKPASGALKLIRKLRGSSKPSVESGEKKMAMLRRLPRILKFIPGKSQDLRAWFMCMQYWLGSSGENIDAMIRFLVSRYASDPALHQIKAPDPIEYTDVGLYHPDLPTRITTQLDALPFNKNAGTVGVLLMRSYILSRDAAHYDAVIRALESKGLNVVAAFASGLDSRPAIDAYFKGRVDAVISLTGFSLVGGPAYNDSDAAQAILADLDVPYIAAHPLEFQTIEQWADNATGLGPVETTMLVALPELDGATNPTVFAGRHGNDQTARDMAPIPERVVALTDRVHKLAALRRSDRGDRKLGIVLFGFPPNAGAVGSAAYLGVWESLWNTLNRLKTEGYDVDVPASLDDLKAAVLGGNAEKFGQEANVLAHVSADRIVQDDPHLAEVEAQWGPAPGRAQSDGRGVFVLGAQFGNVLVGVQPAFGFEGDPMRLLFERGFAPTHAFCAFYRYLRTDFGADVLLHFGMHGALEFMPGKQAGPSDACWPDRLIGDLPNVYLYAANNPSEASLAKRRSNAVTVTHLTPPLAQAGLYKGLLELKESLTQWRAMDPDAPGRDDLAVLMCQQAAAVDMDGTHPDRLWTHLIETETSLITDGLHVVGRPISAETCENYLDLMHHDDAQARAHAARMLRGDGEMEGLINALDGRYIRPVAGGDIIRNAAILPTGRNIHAFDPFRMPTAFALAEGAKQAQLLLDTHASLPRTVAMVLWGSDNIKSDGGPIAQALALIGATPRFDEYGRLSGADLIPLDQLGRPRIDVVMTLSGIFRDLLPLQVRMLAEAAFKAATADEPLAQNFIRAHALDYAEKIGTDLETAALRVFSNAEGAYGANVNHLIDSGAWDGDEDLANAYEKRKCFAYDRKGKSNQHAELLQKALGDVDLAYQNLESVELGVTTVDHYFDTLGGISRAVKRAKGEEAPVYVGDQTRGDGKVRTLGDQVTLETRTRSLNPKWFEGLLKHGAEGVHQIETQITNTLGWSATTGSVEPWVYQRLSETFVLDDVMRKRLADLNPAASARMANRLLEAHARDYWQPDAETLEALQQGADELEDRLEGIGVAAE